MLALLSLLSGSPLLGTAVAAEFGVSGYGGYLVVPPRLMVDPGWTAGGRLRYRWDAAWGVELSVGTSPAGLDPRVEVLHFFDDGSTLTPFFALGGGLLLGTEELEGGWLADVGGGLDAGLTRWLDLRTDLRLRVSGVEQPVIGSTVALSLQLHTPRVRDLDQDGVADDVDTCKDQAEDADGFDDADGCPDPDNDKDGLLDGADTCPAEAEDVDQFSDQDGCPDPDNDKDGIADASDKCPNRPEDKDSFEDENGCPDRDNDKDGIPDDQDGAPNEAETFNGYQDKDGKPDELPEQVRRFSGRIEGILFKTGSAEILPASFPILDQAVAMMQQFPEVRVEVQGHTDDVGDDNANLKLSQDRAESVVAYLVSKGVSRDRLVAKGYGETKPEVPNTDEPGRAKNRRVEFHAIRDEKKEVKDE